MSKKILVLTGSPRKNGNTNKMAEAFIRGAKESGHEVVRFDAAGHNLGGCKACDACWSKGEACIQADDFNKLATLLENSEVILITSPLYWFGFPAQLKDAIDRLYAYLNPACPRPIAVKESYLFVCGGSSDWQDEYEPLLQSYRMICDSMSWINKGILQTGGINAQEALEASDILKKADEMGRNVGM